MLFPHLGTPHAVRHSTTYINFRGSFLSDLPFFTGTAILSRGLQHSFSSSAVEGKHQLLYL